MSRITDLEVWAIGALGDHSDPITEIETGVLGTHSELVNILRDTCPVTARVGRVVVSSGLS